MKGKIIQRAEAAHNGALLIKNFLYRPLAVAPEQEIVYRDSKRYNYQTLYQRIGQLANGLAKLGVRAGDTVAVMDWDSHRYLECFFSVPMMGAILQTVNVRLHPEQVLYTLNHAKPSILLVNTDFLPLLTEIIDRVETVQQFILINDEAEAPETAITFCAEYESLVEAADSHYDFPDLDENTQATTFYTTGTTGLPKGVYSSHRQMVVHTLGLLTTFAMQQDQGRFHNGDVYMPITPMFHVYAWSFPYVATLMGVKQVYPGRYTPDMLLALKQKEGVTFSHCVSTILHMLLSHEDSQNMDLSDWKIAIGGGPLPKGQAQAALDRGIDLFGAYGMSESGPLLCVSHLKPELAGQDNDEALTRRTLAGLPGPLVELRVVDAEMNDVPRDGKSTGEIVARAPWLTQGYFDNPDASEDLWAGGYMHTGDVGIIDDQGYLQVTDRMKDVIKSGGEWVSSLEVEDLLSQHAAVDEAAVIGVKDARWGERPLALIVTKANAETKLTAEDIRAHLMGFVEKGITARISVPEAERVLFVDQLPRTSVGKIDKKALRAQYD